MDSVVVSIPGPAASESVARPDLASEGRGTARTDLGPTPPSPVTLEHGLREKMEKMLSQPQKAVFIGKQVRSFGSVFSGSAGALGCWD